MNVRQGAGLTFTFECIKDRKRYFAQGKEDRFGTCPFGYLSQCQDLTLRMSMFAIGSRVRVDQHHAIDIVDVGKHRYACLICQEQSQQHQGNEYVSTLLHPFDQIGCKSSCFMSISQICYKKYLLNVKGSHDGLPFILCFFQYIANPFFALELLDTLIANEQ